ncbi:MAG: hypothetical protein M1837_003774 [Sclerophora amabilis]|nr:MAG: hypothetical protein M1837_003774 [Sclerophora amabilis]
MEDPRPYSSVPSSPPPTNRPHSFRRQLSRNNASVAHLEPVNPRAVWLLIYKHKGDKDVVARHPLTALRSCALENYATRKGSVPIQTLVLTFEPESAHGKRQSSHSTNLSLKSPPPEPLIFRCPPETPNAIINWNRALQTHLPARAPPQSPPFSKINFASAEAWGRPSTSTTRPALMHSPDSYMSNPSTASHSALISPALSLHSSRTGITSPSSNSPNKFFETFDPPPSEESLLQQDRLSNSSLDPQESILDRAFTMNCIPGYKTPPPGRIDGSMTSIARFEALMQEMDARKAVLSLEEGPDEEECPTSVVARRNSQHHSHSSLFPVSTNSSTIVRPRRKSRPTSLTLSPINSKHSSLVISGTGNPGDDPHDWRHGSSAQSSSMSTANNGRGGGGVGGVNNGGAMRRSITDFTWRLSSVGDGAQAGHVEDPMHTMGEKQEQEDADAEEEVEDEEEEDEESYLGDYATIDTNNYKSSLCRVKTWHSEPRHQPLGSREAGRRRRQGGVWVEEDIGAVI